MTDFATLRDAMVERQIAGRGLTSAPLLAAMRAVPREAFVPEAMRPFAYEDGPLPIEAGQTISQPWIVAFMIDAAGVKPGGRVLEIGAGSGYAAAVLSRIADEVIAIERHDELAAQAATRLARLGYTNVRIVTGDGSAGWPNGAPYDAILVAASGRQVPDILRRQLRVGGTLVMPLGAPGGAQTLVRVIRAGDDSWVQDTLAPVRFVPLIGVEGWPQ